MQKEYPKLDTPIDKRTIKIDGFKNKNITILVSRKCKNITYKNGESYVKNLRKFILVYFTNSDICSVHIYPSNLKKSHVFIEDIDSDKLRNKLIKKYIKR